MTTVDVHYHSKEEVMALFEERFEEEKKRALLTQNDKELKNLKKWEKISDKKKRKSIGIETYDLPENWEKWEQMRSRFPHHRYLFFKKTDHRDPKFAVLYFIDILKAALLIQEYYPLFKQELGEDFHPLEAVRQFEKGSELWDKINDNALLFGLLAGFGLENSSTFKWKYSNNYEHQNEPFYAGLQSTFSDTSFKRNGSLSDLSLPIFASFSEGKDPVVEKYRQERREIHKIYNGRDFLDLTLKKLTR